MPCPRTFPSIDLGPLSEEELGLARKLIDLPEVVRGAVEALEPHRVPFYLLELAGDFHRYYNKPSNRIISEQRELSLARLYLARLIMDGIRSGLDLIGCERSRSHVSGPADTDSIYSKTRGSNVSEDVCALKSDRAADLSS